MLYAWSTHLIKLGEFHSRNSCIFTFFSETHSNRPLQSKLKPLLVKLGTLHLIHHTYLRHILNIQRLLLVAPAEITPKN